MIRQTLAAMLVAACATWTSAHAAPSTEQLAAAMLHQMGQTTAVTLGAGPRVVDVFFDPNCPYCHELYEDLEPWVGKQGLQLRWIPVAVLAPSSEGKAAAMLQAPVPAKALARNLKVLHAAGAYFAFPMMVWRDQDGHVQMFLGAPRDAAQLKTLLATVR